MGNLLKNVVKRSLATFGYQMTRIEQSTPERNSLLYQRVYAKESLLSRRFYNIGAGNFLHRYWTNIDFRNPWYDGSSNQIDLHCDLMKCEELPVESGTAEVVYSSHTIEHVSDAAMRRMFSEAHRILKRGGCFRITGPNVDVLYRAFNEPDREFFADSVKYYSNPEVMAKLQLKSMSQASIGALFLYYVAAPASPLTTVPCERKFDDNEIREIFSRMPHDEALDFLCSFCNFDAAKAGYHINWANAGKVSRYLERSGFSKVVVSAYGQSAIPILRDLTLFDCTVPEWSFYVEAYK